MGFRSPLTLLALLLVPALGALLWFAQHHREQAAVRFAAADMLDGLVPKASRWRTLLPLGLLVAAATFGVVALSQPTWKTKVPRQQSTLVLTLDVSLSMKATDVKPTRLAAAKSAAVATLDALPAEMRAGVVAFSSSAQIVEPPTRDHAQAAAAVRALTYEQGTAVGDGIMTSLDALGAASGGKKRKAEAIVLMSDGDTQSGVDPQFAAERAKAFGVPVYTVGFGTQGATINVDGQEIPVDVDENDLRMIAKTTGGRFFRALDGEALERIFKEVGERVGLEETTLDLSAWFGGTAILLLLGALGCSLWWFGRVV